MASKGDIVYERAPITEEEFDRVMLKAMHEANIHRALIHAYKKTGRILSEQASKTLSKAELQEWNDAVDEWYDTHEE